MSARWTIKLITFHTSPVLVIYYFLNMCSHKLLSFIIIEF